MNQLLDSDNVPEPDIRFTQMSEYCLLFTLAPASDHSAEFGLGVPHGNVSAGVSVAGEQAAIVIILERWSL